MYSSEGALKYFVYEV